MKRSYCAYGGYGFYVGRKYLYLTHHGSKCGKIIITKNIQEQLNFIENEYEFRVDDVNRTIKVIRLFETEE